MLAFLPHDTRWLHRLTLLLGFAAIFWICTFKIMDRDFWWHITAGDIMWKTGTIIDTEPFAHTREGLPYLATHEWLAQILLSSIYRLLGSTGIILFRGVVASVSVGLLLLLAPRRYALNILLAVWGVVIAKGSFLERPQLFTFVLFTLCLLLAFRFLDTQSRRSQYSILAAIVLAELLWVNMHGAAALLGCAVVTFLLVEKVFYYWRNRMKENRNTVLLLIGTLVLMSIVLILPPNGFGNLRYLWDLMSDQTIVYIAEWRARDWGLYIAELWPFWVLALGSLWIGRRHWIFTVLLLLMTAYLSRQAFRHEVLFIFAALAVCFYQMGVSERADFVWAWMQRRRHIVVAIILLLMIVLGRAAYVRSMDFERQDNLYGFGQFDLARVAYDFVEREKLSGNMFNTYGIGGYLMYRGYPDRKIFIDGRNVDYGFDFLTLTYAAGVNPERWDELADRYDINYAIVDYDAIREKNRLPYSVILDRNSSWPLVYLDDWVAVYMKDTLANRSVIDRYQYKHLTATDIQFNNTFEGVSDEVMPELTQELNRMRQDNPQGVKARLALAKIALRRNGTVDAKILAEEVINTRPYSPEAYAVLGAAYVSEQQWHWAADAFDQVLRYAGNEYPDMNYGFIADVYENAGRPWKARLIRRKDRSRDIAADVQTQEPAGGVSLSGASLIANPSVDAHAFNEQGVSEAEQGMFAEAEQSFLTALKLNPGSAEIWNNLCALRLSHKDPANAVEACTRAIALNAEFADAHFNLALAHYHLDEFAKAQQEALEAKRLGREKESDELLLLIRRMKF